MAGNRGVVYTGPGKVEVQDVPDPALENPQGRDLPHGVILKVVASNICGSDLHMVHGRTAARPGIVLGHEITGEVVECGPDVETLEVGDMVSVPFNVACGRCRNCHEGDTHACLRTNPEQPGAAYGYVSMGGWMGGQTKYVMAPYADFNLLKFPDRDQALEKIRHLTLLSDVLPTGFHGAVEAQVGVGSTVYVSGAGPVGLCAAASARLMGAAAVLIGDTNRRRLDHAARFGFVPIDLSEDADLPGRIAAVLGRPMVDSAIDCVGYEARGLGKEHDHNVPTAVLNALAQVTRAAGAVGVPGVYMPEDPGGANDEIKHGYLTLGYGQFWSKGLSMHTGQTPVLRYNRQLMEAILWDRLPIGDILGVEIIPLEEAPRGYEVFDGGAPKKFVLDPHGELARAA